MGVILVPKKCAILKMRKSKGRDHPICRCVHAITLSLAVLPQGRRWFRYSAATARDPVLSPAFVWGIFIAGFFAENRGIPGLVLVYTGAVEARGKLWRELL